jgi:hypothetical protein
MDIRDILALSMTFIFFAAVTFVWWMTRKEELEHRRQRESGDKS